MLKALKSNKRSNRQQSQPTDRATQIRGWLNHHQQLARETWHDLRHGVAATVLTSLVLAIALILPALLYLTQKNLQELADIWQEGAQVTLYLQPEVTTADGEALRNTLAERPEVRSARFFSQSDATTELSTWLGISNLLETLEQNPLPASIVITPVTQTRADMEVLELVFQDLPEVADIQLDIEWVQRLEAINQLLSRLLWVLIVVLAAMVLLVVGNTMRMAVAARQQEIQVIQLVGATDAYIRRPFLYLGFSYGLLGSLCASIGLIISYALLRTPVTDLSGSPLLFLSPLEGLALIVLGIMLSMLSTWLTVVSALRRIESSPI